MTTNPHFSLRDLLENADLLVAPSTNNDKDDKLKNFDNEPAIDFSSAFLGPVLWDKTLPFDEDDFKLESLGLQEFFDENELLGTAVAPEMVCPQPSRPSVTPPLQKVHVPIQSPVPSEPASPPPKDDYESSMEEEGMTLATIPGQEGFDPRKRKFSEEELKPQPMIKKSKKIYVPTEMKDEQYWGRRNKNNAAAKRSRDARRVKENQIAMRASFLEKENGTLKSDLEKVQLENIALKKRLSQYEIQARINGGNSM